MKKIYLAVIACALMPISAFADSLYLNCHLISGSGLKITDAYKKTPKNPQKQFIEDALQQGIIGYFIEPPTTWEINLSEKTIVSPEESHKIFNVTSISNNKIEGGSQFGAFFSLNRINANLDYSLHIRDEATTAWKKAHGGTIPTILQYKFNCISKSNSTI